MAVMVGQWQNFNNNNSEPGEFVLPYYDDIPASLTNLPEFLALKFLPLTYHFLATIYFTTGLLFCKGQHFFYNLNRYHILTCSCLLFIVSN